MALLVILPVLREGVPTRWVTPDAFLPSFLLVAGALPFWNALSRVRSRCCGA